MKILKKIFLKTLKVNELSEDDLSFLYKKFNKELRQYFIEQELPIFGIDKKDRQVRESLSGLYQSEDYKIFSRLICNYKNRLGYKLMKIDSTEIRRKQDPNGNMVLVSKFSDSYWRGFFDGQSKFISYILALVRHAHRKLQEEDKKEDKKGEK